MEILKRERAVGEAFIPVGCTFPIRCIESPTDCFCKGCMFGGNCTNKTDSLVGPCTPDKRTDKKNVIFVRVLDSDNSILKLTEDGIPF